MDQLRRALESELRKIKVKTDQKSNVEFMMRPLNMVGFDVNNRGMGSMIQQLEITGTMQLCSLIRIMLMRL